MKLKGIGKKTKLTDEIVSIIRKRYSNGGGANQSVLAKEFNVDQSTISNIVNYRIWKDVALNDHETRLTNQANVIGGLKSKITKLEKKVGRQDKLIVVLQKRIDALENKQNA